jgi:hypothetical protein
MVVMSLSDKIRNLTDASLEYLIQNASDSVKELAEEESLRRLAESGDHIPLPDEVEYE